MKRRSGLIRKWSYLLKGVQYRNSFIHVYTRTYKRTHEHEHKHAHTHTYIEDEIRFLLNFQYYTNLREHELGLVLNNEENSNKSEDDKLSVLLNDYVRRTAKALLKAFLQRRSKLYG